MTAPAIADPVRQTAAMPPRTAAASWPHPLGVHPRDGGVDVAVFAAHADLVQLCLLDDVTGDTGDTGLAGDPGDPGGPRWKERRIDLTRHIHGVWHGHVPDVPVGQRYGLRVHGPWNPRQGHRHNPAKLLLDPYARAVVPPPGLRPELFGHVVDDLLEGDPRLPDPRDSAQVAAHGVVVSGDRHGRPGSGSTRPRVPWPDTVIYEAHVRGLTRRLPGVPEELRGTYAGLAHPATLEHLVGLGVTSVELLPVHSLLAEPHLARRGLPNYWGYSTLGFFAPHLGYASTRDPVAAVGEFAAMVQALHSAGLEVLLDVVYNHTCETGVRGPTLSLRGLDARSYYRLDGDGRDIDFTGCGNSLDATHDRVVQLVLDSLRYWVSTMDVDGFRFDLAPTLARGNNEFYPRHPMLVAMRTDPVLADVKLIAEPWDLGPDASLTAACGPPFPEGNDCFLAADRSFWPPCSARARAGESTSGVRDLGTRLAGSADTFEASRGPTASVNLVTAHDGFTLADLVAFNHKHNEANGEADRDGTDHNRSWNHGVEGWAGAPDDVLAARRRTLRNLLGTLLLSAGVPMLLAGDEFGRSQRGNNNPYCLDDETSWVSWDLAPWQADLADTTRHLLRLRRRFTGVRSESFFTGEPGPGGGRDLSWYTAGGSEMGPHDWADGRRRTVLVLFGGAGATGVTEEGLLLVISGEPAAQVARLPVVAGVTSYTLLWDSTWESPEGAGPALPPGSTVPVAALSVQAYAVR